MSLFNEDIVYIDNLKVEHTQFLYIFTCLTKCCNSELSNEKMILHSCDFLNLDLINIIYLLY